MGEEAIDLATALDQYEESDDEPQGDAGSDSSGSEENDEESEESEQSESDFDEEDNEADPENLEALQGLVSKFGGREEDDADNKVISKPKISLGDLGLSGLDDPFMNKSVKLMKKEDKEKRPGAGKKLDVPLARREQARLDRTVAYDKTNETLDRWTETVKQNRRADHLVFPLPQNSATAGLDTTEIQPLTAKNSTNELESTIFSIMEQSGLSMEKQSAPKEPQYDEDGNVLSQKEIQNRKRLERELNSREAKRAKRIKKIKSKSYHRVHRKQRERDEVATREAREEAGEIDSEEEREAQDRRRALERVGQRHKDSKWAKLGSKNKRAVWDDDFRTGLADMARKDEELRRRKEGRAVGSDDETSSSGSDDDEAALHRRLDELDDEDDEPQSKLMGMKFMQKAEAARKQANDEMVNQIRRELDGEDMDALEEVEKEEVGRRQYGVPNGKTEDSATDTIIQTRRKGPLSDKKTTGDPSSTRSNGLDTSILSATPVESTAHSTAGAWSRGDPRRKKKGSASARAEDLDLNANILVAATARPPKPKPRKAPNPTTAAADAAQDDDDDGESDPGAADLHMPLAIRDQELVARAFAGEDVVGDFARDKDDVADEDDDRVVDNTLPGWGTWVGEGVSGRDQRRHQGRFVTKVEGVKKKQDRRDARLDNVIINEKRIKKVRIPFTPSLPPLLSNLPKPTDPVFQNDRYLASQLPHPFESRAQYERSLRLPVGPEWMTKETFQDGTKPRVLMKQGVITPISKPVI